MAISPFYVVMGAKVFAAIVCMLVKISVVIALTLCMNNAADLSRQRDLYFYKGESKVIAVPEQEIAMDDNIWEDNADNLETR